MNFTPLRNAGLTALIASSIAFGAVSVAAQQSTPDATPSAPEIVCDFNKNDKPGELKDGKKYVGDAKVTLDEAIATAKTKASGDLGPVELDREHGKLQYEVEIGHEVVLIDAETGEVIKVRINDDCYTMIGDVKFEDDDSLVGTVSITPEQAMEIAKGEVDGTVRSIELEEDNGKVTYDVEIDSSEVTIDANSGKVIRVDHDDD